jgi:hypothetical protein
LILLPAYTALYLVQLRFQKENAAGIRNTKKNTPPKRIGSIWAKYGVPARTIAEAVNRPTQTIAAPIEEAVRNGRVTPIAILDHQVSICTFSMVRYSTLSSHLTHVEELQSYETITRYL